MATTMLRDTTKWPDSPLSCNNILLRLYHIVPKALLLSISRIFLAIFKQNHGKLLLYKTDKSRTTRIKDSYRRRKDTWECSPSHLHGGSPRHLSGVPGLQFGKHAPGPQLCQLLFPRTLSVNKFLLESLQHVRHVVGT